MKQWEREENIGTKIHRNMKKLTEKFRKESQRRVNKCNIHKFLDNNNKTLIDHEDIKRYSKTYIEQLFESRDVRLFELSRDFDSSPSILSEEVMEAIKNTKAGKTQPDQLHIETVKLFAKNT